ncbi:MULTISPECIES: branched-chain amino acid transport system II carrier protein [unclassified Clostridium]|uniref:branched-chain amino acid transport system II carrier protein n=1 Tax=unclassified Clostridium TaxID=2614128 RepID=UPI001C8B6C33|nr:MULTISPECIES: branched-chain amino acid transport system II carrier protein [unclassified Clostridium]MBX9138899.1 branched-chain amino acid transport system II carrier protein [Clostridium sp. K12(2020)]MBX9145690.1 branched-chain amino acid transport system II carrier protein [Clostridium sp. K13]MDU2292092.1 branched-chain amino acid transport system II carrier protein [Clostridium celatum]
MKNKTRDSIVVGFALFSMFFGAGNLIFPPSLGNKLGDQYLLGILGFILTGVGLPLLAILACSKGNGTFESITNKIGTKFTLILTTVLFFAIGPLLAIPRTAATTFEISILPFFPTWSPIIVMAIYFLINLFFVLKRSSIIDTIGKFLTPALIIVLTIVIVKGIIDPIGELVPTGATNILSMSLLEGYQTMDALGALLFAGVITSSIVEKGYKGSEVKSVLLKASLIAVVGLAFVYGGLTFIGAHTVNLVDSGISNTALLVFIANKILGTFGLILIGTAIGLACLTTSIGLLTAGATFFEKVSNGKLSYKFNAIAISLMSYIIACQGVDKIVKLSVPILNVLYPVAITIIVVTLLNKFLTNIIAIRLAVYTSLVCGFLFSFFGDALSFMPLAGVGFGWVIPTIIALVIGLFIKTKKTA